MLCACGSLFLRVLLVSVCVVALWMLDRIDRARMDLHFAPRLAVCPVHPMRCMMIGALACDVLYMCGDQVARRTRLDSRPHGGRVQTGVGEKLSILKQYSSSL